jgi:hypothetical protein
MFLLDVRLLLHLSGRLLHEADQGSQFAPARDRRLREAPVTVIDCHSTCLAVFCMRRIRVVSSRRRAIAAFVKRP